MSNTVCLFSHLSFTLAKRVVVFRSFIFTHKQIMQLHSCIIKLIYFLFRYLTPYLGDVILYGPWSSRVPASAHAH